MGFAKKHDHNWTHLAAIPAIRAIGLPVLIGASRKRFVGALDEGIDLSAPEQRDDATTAITALAAFDGVWGVRVHEARPSAHSVRGVAHLRARSPQGTS